MRQSLEMAKMIGDAYLVDDYIYAVVKLNGEAVFFENVVDAFDYLYQNKDIFMGTLVQLPIQKTSKHNQQSFSDLYLGCTPSNYDYLIDKKVDGSVKLKFVGKNSLPSVGTIICILAIIADMIFMWWVTR